MAASAAPSDGIKHGGNLFFDAVRNTGLDGEFRIRHQRPSTAGTDKFVFRAFGPGDQECRGQLVF